MVIVESFRHTYRELLNSFHLKQKPFNSPTNITFARLPIFHLRTKPTSQLIYIYILYFEQIRLHMIHNYHSLDMRLACTCSNLFGAIIDIQLFISHWRKNYQPSK